MRKVKILTDSTADLSIDIINKLDIEVLPLTVSFGDESYLDGVNINTEDLYRLVEEKGELPKTSAVAPGEFLKTFNKWLDKDYDIIYLGIGSTLSGTFQSAYVASLELPEDRVFLVDSKNLSSGSGLLVLKANDFKNKGLSAKEIKEKLDDLVPKVRSQFSIQVLDFLHKGGRASGTQALVGKFFRIRPILKVTNGILDVYKKPMGTMTKAVNMMLDEFVLEYQNNNIDLEYLMITHSLNFKLAEYIKEYLTEHNIKVNNVIESIAGCVISSHCGKGTIGILYIVKE